MPGNGMSVILFLIFYSLSGKSVINITFILNFTSTVLFILYVEFLADLQWKAPQDLPVDNYMMPMGMGPSTYNPYWPGGMQPGMEGYMAPFAPPMPYMGYGIGPLEMPFGGFMPQDPYAAQGCMFPGGPPPQR